MRRLLRAGLCAALLAVSFALALASAAARPGDAAGDLIARADKLFEEKTYEEARRLYREAVDAATSPAQVTRAAQRVIICLIRLARFDEALEEAEAGVARAKEPAWEARARRLAGNLYLSVPHWGTRSGGKYRRNVWEQGIQVESTRHDKRLAVAHLERARELYARADGNAAALAALTPEERGRWHDERIECLMDLAGAASRFGVYETDWSFWWGPGELDDAAAETAGEDDFQEYSSRWQNQRRRPLGLALDAAGKPAFAKVPASYAAARGDDEKILALLDEARALDATKERRHAVLATYRQAMLARARFGMDRLSGYASYWWSDGAYPLKEELETQKPWELGPGEALVLAGGKITRAALPPQWDVLALLRSIERDHAEAGYAIGLYLQSRQQYQEAIAQYEALSAAHPKSEWATNAAAQIEKIRRPEAGLSQTGLQLPGAPARLEVQHRNVDRVWLVARAIDLEGFLRSIRDQPLEEDKGIPNFWSLQQWASYFVYDYDDPVRALAGARVGKEVARWSVPVERDPALRYGKATVRAPLEGAGAYLVTAYASEPPKADAEKSGREAMALGASRAVLAITDLAFVEKHVKDGNLYYVCDAAHGAPVAGAKLSLLEMWSTWDQPNQKSVYHKATHELTTDAQGLALLPRPGRDLGQLHMIVKAGGVDGAGRLAWSGMDYWGWYTPSTVRQGLLAYCITDRPVYRPGQTVQVKVWLREMKEGNLGNVPSRAVSLDVYDPRGSKVHSASGSTDPMGGFETRLTLGDEPPLGQYSVYVAGATEEGGNVFRVEEYKKPELEVTVEPAKTHARLGEKVGATVRARYYFGAPVTQATVKYKVLREEYVHGYVFPGEWDWLYGPGYGWVWYAYDWLPWWGRWRCCWCPPYWWWGGYGVPAPTPVRELVMEGEAPIGADGTLALEIDTGGAKRDHGDRDHRYVVQAEVRDASRRVVTGEGAVTATRQSFYAFVQPDKGWYAPGEEMVVRLRCVTSADEPVEAEGVLTVSEVVYGGEGNARVEETERKRMIVRTDATGAAEVRLRAEKGGQWKLRFETPDQWGGAVEGFALAWVVGPEFDGKLYRFNDLELVTDKRTYRPGETAHVMVSTKNAGSHVLWSDQVDSECLLSWKLLSLAGKSTIVDVPITDERRPNFFVEATTVAGMRVHQQSRQICVPPEEGIMSVTVTTDKREYRPGETMRVTVTAVDREGKPARAQVVLSAFDKSVLYIQPELTPPIAGFFHGRLRAHQPQMTTNVLEQLAASASLVRPFESLDPPAPSWYGVWGPEIGDWRTIEDTSLETMSGLRKHVDKRISLGQLPAGSKEVGVAGATLALDEEQRADGAAPMGQPAAARGMLRDGKDRLEGKDDGKKAGEPTSGGGALVEATVRKLFADTAAFLPSLTTDERGRAEASFPLPENLTTWKLNAWGMTEGSRVGQSSTQAVTTKNLLVRLQAPRFFTERDEVVVSANVHNYLRKAKKARVSLALPEALLSLAPGSPATVEVTVPSGGEARVDWRLAVRSEGLATLTVKALTDEESDAMQLRVPVLVHGMLKQVATTASLRPKDEAKSLGIELVVPEQRRPELTRLEVAYSPSLIGAMLDAVPYCLRYPYGCTEQTVDRFLPAALTRKTLRALGMRLEDVREVRGRMAEIRRMEKDRHMSVYADSPVFDDEELEKIIAASLSRIANMQQGDGGWGWWATDRSDAYLTSYVLFALASARDADVAVNDAMIQRGATWLKSWEEHEMRNVGWAVHAQHAFVAYSLSLAKQRAAIEPAADDKRPGDLLDRLFAGRDKLTLYGKALLSLALANEGDEARARTVLANILQYQVVTEETETARFRVPEEGWWWWWNGEIDTNAWCLRALVRLEPKSDLAPKVAKWLLNNRRNGYYWRSTQDTTLCVAAIGEFVQASGEADADYTLRLDLDDGAVVKEVKIDRKNFFSFDGTMVVEGAALKGGTHRLKVTKTGKGALYVSTYLRTFTMEEPITASGHELHVKRSYFRLSEVTHTADVEGAAGQALEERRLRYERVPVKEGDVLASGDLVQVELLVSADNDYSFLALEDRKAAGLEPVDVRSGNEGQEGFLSYRELRDEKVVFFMGALERGEHLLRYRLRAEAPGVFHALPSVIYAMYAPELRANGDEAVIRVRD